jgi:hypothetical protein
MQQRPAGRRRLDAAAAALQERHPGLLLHAPHPRARRRQRQAGARGTRRDAPRLGHMKEQAQVDQVKMHGLRSACGAFVPN